MSAPEKRFPLFFGSTVVLGCFLGMMGSSGSMLFTSIGVLIKPLSEEFGWARDEISYGATLISFGIVFGLLTSGFLIDKFGARRVLIVSVLLSIFVVATGPLYITALPLFYTMLVLASIVGGPTNTSGYARVIASWFDRRRGLFIGINACGMGLGFFLAPLITDMAVNAAGWKAGYYCIALFMFLVALPSVLFLVIDKPQDVGLEVDGDKKRGVDKESVEEQSTSLSLKQAAKTPAFWLMIYIVPALAFALQGTLIHMVPLLIDRGIESSTAAIVASSVGLSMGASRLIVGYFLDYVFAPRLAMVIFSFASLSILLIIFTNSLPLYFLAAVLIGFGLGTEGDLMAYMVSRYFGMKNFASIFSTIFSFYILGSGAGPAFFGRSFVANGDYTQIHFISFGLMISAIVLFAFLAPYDRYLATGKEIDS
ncbi:MAG: MFS transporter [Gammaproteobacteria bacterium]|nr:MFS transporter [Gammaproteobacteria bacterium]